MRVRMLLTMAVTVVSLAVGSSVQAAPTRTVSDANRAAIAQSQTEHDEQAEVVRLAPFYNQKAGSLDGSGALAAGISSKVVSDFQRGLTLSKTSAGVNAAAELAGSGCVGRSAVQRDGTAARIWANSCQARTVTSALDGITGIAAATAVIANIWGLPLTIAAGIVGALAAFGKAAVGYCSRRGRGIVMQNLGWPPCYNQ